MTDTSAFNDSSPNTVVQVGIGPDASDPVGNGSWVWTRAAPNPGWDGTSSGEPNNDEWFVTANSPPEVGEYDVAFRFSVDQGRTFLYCDGGAPGSSDGYSAGDAGRLIVSDWFIWRSRLGFAKIENLPRLVMRWLVNRRI
ncbi:MAG: hypothetical protein AAFY60_11175, partial [Myxococcota bacterium]